MRTYATDPRVRQTLNQISENFESANQRTQDSLYTFSERFLWPCLDGLRPCVVSCQTCLEAACQPCFNAHDELRRQRQPRYSRRGREGASFDFYDDWEQDEEEWGNDEMDALLAGNESQQPSRQQGMTYGGYGTTRGARSKGTNTKDLAGNDPTIVPRSSAFGFLERLPWRIGGRGTKYWPRAATLQENVGKRTPDDHSASVGKKGKAIDTLFAGSEASGSGWRKGKTRHSRSDTVDSRETANSLSSRGDIFPSDEELDDAHEIDDETAYALGRSRTGGTLSDDKLSGKRLGIINSRDSTRTDSSRESHGRKKKKNRRSGGDESISDGDLSLKSSMYDSTPSINDLTLAIADQPALKSQESKHVLETVLQNPTDRENVQITSDTTASVPGLGKVAGVNTMGLGHSSPPRSISDEDKEGLSVQPLLRSETVESTSRPDRGADAGLPATPR